MPIKDRGLFEFVRAWGPKAVRSDIWVGMRMKTLNRTADVADSDKKLKDTLVETAVHTSGEDVTDEDKAQVGISRARYILNVCIALAVSVIYQ